MLNTNSNKLSETSSDDEEQNNNKPPKIKKPNSYYTYQCHQTHIPDPNLYLFDYDSEGNDLMALAYSSLNLQVPTASQTAAFLDDMKAQAEIVTPGSSRTNFQADQWPGMMLNLGFAEPVTPAIDTLPSTTQAMISLPSTIPAMISLPSTTSAMNSLSSTTPAMIPLLSSTPARNPIMIGSARVTNAEDTSPLGSPGYPPASPEYMSSSSSSSSSSNESRSPSPKKLPSVKLDPEAALPGPGSLRGLGVGGVVGTTTLSGPSPLLGSGAVPVPVHERHEDTQHGEGSGDVVSTRQDAIVAAAPRRLPEPRTAVARPVEMDSSEEETQEAKFIRTSKAVENKYKTKAKEVKKNAPPTIPAQHAHGRPGAAGAGGNGLTGEEARVKPAGRGQIRTENLASVDDLLLTDVSEDDQKPVKPPPMRIARAVADDVGPPLMEAMKPSHLVVTCKGLDIDKRKELMTLAQFNPKLDVYGHLKPRRGGPPIGVYLILKHCVSEQDVHSLQNSLDGLSSGFLGECVIKTEMK